MTIMIVDDSAAMRLTIRRMLSGEGVAISECNDGAEAVKTYPKLHPDWVLMDIKMKQMDGFQATWEIISQFPDAKIIMITQYDDPKLEKKAHEMGAIEFVLKEKLMDIERIIHGQKN
jgi:CheY-like chemotaxis protein